MSLIAKIGKVRCAACGDEAERFIKADDNWTCKCKCGGVMGQNMMKHERAPAGVIEYGNGQGVPLLTEGCHPSEVEQYRRGCPSLEVRDDGTFITRNRSHTRTILKELARFRGS